MSDMKKLLKDIGATLLVESYRRQMEKAHLQIHGRSEQLDYKCMVVPMVPWAFADAESMAKEDGRNGKYIAAK